MNKTDLINEISAKAGVTKAQAKLALDATLGAISASLAKNEKVVAIGEIGLDYHYTKENKDILAKAY